MNEVKDRELIMDRRERDREVWGGMFNNEYLRQGALDLFDVQACFDDTWEAARLVHPELLNHFQASVLQGTWQEVALNNMRGSISMQDLVPLFRCLVHLNSVVDRSIYYRQMCASSKVGWREI